MKIFSDTRSLLSDDLAPGEKVMIGGDLLFVSLDQDIPESSDMVRQTPRPGSFKLLSDAAPVQVGVNAGVLTLIQSNPKVRFGLTVDWYIDYLRRQRGDVLLIGGAATDYGTKLEVYGLRNGQITLTLGKNLPNMRSSSFFPELSVALDDITERMGRGTLPRVVWAYPLPEFDSSRFGQFEYVGAQQFANVRLPAITSAAGKISSSRLLLPPVLMATAGALIALGLIYWEWQRYQSLQADYQREIAGLETVYQDGSSRLDLLSKRQMMLDTPPSQKALLDRWRRLAAAVAQLDGAVVQSINVFDGTTARSGLGGRSIDFELHIDVPAEAGMSLRVQAKKVLTDLAQLTGFEFWMSQDEGVDGGSMLRLRIEGMSHVQ